MQEIGQERLGKHRDGDEHRTQAAEAAQIDVPAAIKSVSLGPIVNSRPTRTVNAKVAASL